MDQFLDIKTVPSKNDAESIFCHLVALYRVSHTATLFYQSSLGWYVGSAPSRIPLNDFNFHDICHDYQTSRWDPV